MEICQVLFHFDAIKIPSSLEISVIIFTARATDVDDFKLSDDEETVSFSHFNVCV